VKIRWGLQHAILETLVQLGEKVRRQGGGKEVSKYTGGGQGRSMQRLNWLTFPEGGGVKGVGPNERDKINS